MTSEQFFWRGNGTVAGYPIFTESNWPAIRSAGSLWGSKNLLWLFGGSDTTVLFGDLSTFSDSMIIFINIEK